MADANYSDVVLLLPMNGADGGTTFTDYAPVPKTVSVYGNTHTETDQSKFYGASGAFDGNDDYFTVSPVTDFSVGSADFTIEAWIYNTSSASTLKQIFSHYNGGIALYLTTANKLAVAKDAVAQLLESGSALSTNAWHHVAACKTGGNLYLAVDGAVISVADTTSFSSTGTAYVGRGQIEQYFFGYMQDLRITKGMARYTANFTPPGKLCGTISGTVYDAAGDPAQRTVIAVPRAYPNTRHFATQSSAVDGTYSLAVPDVECSRIVLADETTLYNDIIDRVLPG